jgi:hypothetical protein
LRKSIERFEDMRQQVDRHLQNAGIQATVAGAWGQKSKA